MNKQILTLTKDVEELPWPAMEYHLEVNKANIENNEINNNEIGGDLIIGSVVVKLPNFNIDVSAAALKELISNHEKLREDSPEYEFFLEQLQEKIAAKVNRKVIGLENT